MTDEEIASFMRELLQSNAATIQRAAFIMEKALNDYAAALAKKQH